MAKNTGIFPYRPRPGANGHAKRGGWPTVVTEGRATKSIKVRLSEDAFLAAQDLAEGLGYATTTGRPNVSALVRVALAEMALAHASELEPVAESDDYPVVGDRAEERDAWPIDQTRYFCSACTAYFTTKPIMPACPTCKSRKNVDTEDIPF